MSADTTRVKQEVSDKDVHLWVTLGNSYVTDDAISLDEMNVAMRSVAEKSLSANESGFLVKQFGEQPLTWNRFIEMLLIL